MTDLTLNQPSPIVVKYSKIRVGVISGPDSGQLREFASDTLNVGTSSDNQLALSDPAVSRLHFSVAPTRDGARIRDEDSTNGIFIAGTRIFDVIVSSDVIVNAGNTTLRVQLLDEKVSREQSSSDRFGEMRGRSDRMRQLFAELAQWASSDMSILIEGETGTGKELVAASIHAASARAEQPFEVFDCSATAPNLVESELFGHERGAYTGAVGTRQGAFELANGGTIFLDELGELSKEVQPKLLRVLEQREIRRLGSSKTVKLDVRVVAATNRSLYSEVQRGRFREDLYYRLAGATVRVPPLRERIDDIPLLVKHFLQQLGRTHDIDSVPENVWAMFRAYRWPGNVRELRNAVQRFTIAPDRVLPHVASGAAEGLPPTSASHASPLLPLPTARSIANDEFEKQYLERLLRLANRDINSASAAAKVSRQMIQRLLRKHGLTLLPREGDVAPEMSPGATDRER